MRKIIELTIEEYEDLVDQCYILEDHIMSLEIDNYELQEEIRELKELLNN